MESAQFLPERHDLAGKFMTEDAGECQARMLAVESVQVRAADRAGMHLNDRVAVGFNLRVVHPLVADVAGSVIAQRFHWHSSRAPLSNAVGAATTPQTTPWERT